MSFMKGSLTMHISKTSQITYFVAVVPILGICLKTFSQINN